MTGLWDFSWNVNSYCKRVPEANNCFPARYNCVSWAGNWCNDRFAAAYSWVEGMTVENYLFTKIKFIIYVEKKIKPIFKITGELIKWKFHSNIFEYFSLPEMHSLETRREKTHTVTNLPFLTVTFWHSTSNFHFLFLKKCPQPPLSCSQLVCIGNQLLGHNTPLEWEMAFQLKSQQPEVPEVWNLDHMQHMPPCHRWLHHP